jgi:hypothetical protein
MQLSRVIFWDTDYEMIDWEKNARYVIARAIMYGTIEDWRTIQAAEYGMDRIHEEMLQERDLDPKSLSFLSCIFNIPKENFRCWKEVHSTIGYLI